MKDESKQKKMINEITNFVISAPDNDNLVLSAFITGLQIGRSQKEKNVDEKIYNNLHIT